MPEAVSDDPDALDFLSTVLQDNGFATTLAKDGNEAIAMIQQAPPDLVTQLKSIPVIIITGVSDDFQKFISTRRQVPPPEGYISKPVDHAQFLSMVRELLA